MDMNSVGGLSVEDLEKNGVVFVEPVTRVYVQVILIGAVLIQAHS